MKTYIVLSLMQTTCGRKSVFDGLQSLFVEEDRKDPLPLRQAYANSCKLIEGLLSHQFRRLQAAVGNKEKKDMEKETREQLAVFANDLLAVAWNPEWPAAEVALTKLMDWSYSQLVLHAFFC
jgi:hypothetical protein